MFKPDKLKSNTVRVTFSCLMFLSLFNTPSWSQAFNCKYAKLEDERAICRDDSLKALDEQMSERFFRIKQELPETGQKRLAASQKAFLEKRGVCASDGDCIDAVHVEHLAFLCRLAEEYGVACK